MPLTWFTRRAFVGVALVGALLAGAACGSGDETTEPSATPHHNAQATAADQIGDEVVMRLIAYRPEELTVTVGASVRWKQQDAGFHTVTSGIVKKDPSGSVDEQPDGTFVSGELAKDETFAFTFDEAGTYPYFCEIHPATMSGRVSVA